MADKQQADADEQTGGAVLFDLESAAVNGHAVAYAAVEGVFKAKGITLSPSAYARYCLAMQPSAYVKRLLQLFDKPRISADKLTADVEKAIKAAFAGQAVKLSVFARQLLDAARERGLATGFVTALGTDSAQQLLAKVGLSDSGPVIARQSGEGQASFEQWSRAARTVVPHPRLALAVVSDAVSHKAALSARLHCLVLPTRFTAAQDFSGADFVIDEGADLPTDDVLGLLLASTS